MKTGLIYKHTLLTGKQAGWCYIGQTCETNYKKRWRNGHGYAKQRNFNDAIIDNGGYAAGDVAWVHEIIETGITSLEQANERERYGISIYHSGVGDNECKGYNMTPGGSSGGTTGRIKIFKGSEFLFINEKDLAIYEKAGGAKWYTPERKSLERKKYYQEHREQERWYHLKNYKKKARKPSKYNISMADIITKYPSLSIDECRKIYQAEYLKLYRLANKVKVSVYHKNYQIANREKLNNYHRERYKKYKDNLND